MGGESIGDLVEGEDPVELLAGDGLRDGDLPLVVVAGDDLRRVAPELVVAEGPTNERARAVSAADLGRGDLAPRRSAERREGTRGPAVGGWGRPPARTCIGGGPAR
jgi:hypothetical protein